MLVLADDDALRSRIERHLPLGMVGGLVGVPDRVLRINTSPQCMLYAGRRLVRRSRRIGPILRALRRQLQIAVARFSREYLFVHAGVVAWRKRAIVIPGRSFSGKSTLVAALIDAGACYLSDEFARFDQNGWVHAYPRPLTLRRPEGGRTRLHIDAAADGCYPVGAVLLTRFVSQRHWDPRSGSLADGVLGLLANTMAARDTPRRAFEILQRAAADATILVGERGDATEVSGWLLSGAALQREGNGGEVR